MGKANVNAKFNVNKRYFKFFSLFFFFHVPAYFLLVNPCLSLLGQNKNIIKVLQIHHLRCLFKISI